MKPKINNISYELTEDDIYYLVQNTDFTKQDILQWYADFKNRCPSGVLDKKNFIALYKQLLPGNTFYEQNYCEFVFEAFDTDQNGYINFS